MDKSGKTDEINVMEYLYILKKRWRLIAIVVSVAVVGTAIVSLLMTKIYESKGVIIPAGVLGKDQGAASTFLAMQFGLAPPTSPASAEILNLLRSNIIKERVIREHGLIALFLKESDRKKSENEQMWMCLRKLRDMTTVNFTPKDNVIELTVRYKDPEMAEKLVNYYLTELTDHMSSEAKRVAQRNKEYLEAQIDTTADPFIRAKMYSLIAQQIETSTMAEVKENFAFKTLDPPRIPDNRISPRRTLMVILAFVLSLVTGAVGAIVLEKVQGQRVQ
jgi:uncharacterized protein involved in exopolysaccharide biosynthesis